MKDQEIIEQALNTFSAFYFRDLFRMRRLCKMCMPCHMPWLEDYLMETCDIWRLTRKYNRGDVFIEVIPAPMPEDFIHPAETDMAAFKRRINSCYEMLELINFDEVQEEQFKTIYKYGSARITIKKSESEGEE